MKINIASEIMNLKYELLDKLSQENYSETEKIIITLNLSLQADLDSTSIKRLFYSLLRVANIKISTVEDNDDLAFIELNDSKYKIHGIYGFNISQAKSYSDMAKESMLERGWSSKYYYPLSSMFLTKDDLSIENSCKLTDDRVEVLTLRNCLCNINKSSSRLQTDVSDKVVGIMISLNHLCNERMLTDKRLRDKIQKKVILDRMVPDNNLYHNNKKYNSNMYKRRKK